MKNLRITRKEHGMTMKELAEKIGVSESAISQYENGKREPGYKALIELTKIFNVTADYLLGIESDDDAQMSQSDIDMIKTYNNAKQSDKEHIKALLGAIDKLLKVDE